MTGAGVGEFEICVFFSAAAAGLNAAMDDCECECDCSEGEECLCVMCGAVCDAMMLVE